MINKTFLKRPLKTEDQLLLNAGQTYYRMLQGEHSAKRLTFIKLPFVFKIFFYLFWVAAWAMFYCINNLHVPSVLWST